MTGIRFAQDRQQAILTIAVLALLAIALYGPMIGWGVPLATAPERTKTFATDEILPLEALAEMHNTFVASKPDRNYGYPWWHYFVVSVAQAPYIALLVLSGGLQGLSPEFPFGLQDPVGALRVLTLIGRSVSVVMGAGTVVAAYLFSRALWGHVAGTVAALLTMLNYLMIYYSRTGNVDVPAFFWSSLGLVVFATIFTRGLSSRRAAWLGVFAGLAMATKDQAFALFLPLGFVLLLPHFHRLSGSRYSMRPILIGLSASLAAYVLGTGMLIDPHRHITHVYSLLFDQNRITAAEAYWPPHPMTWAGAVALTGDFFRALVALSSLPVLLTSLAGVIMAFRYSPRHMILLLPVAGIVATLILPTRLVVLRYLLPLTLIIDAFAAYALIALRQSRLRPAWVPLLILLCGWRLLIGADLTYAQYHDTRYGASEWLQAHVQAGERVEYFGVTETLPPLPGSIETRRVAGRVQWVGEFGHGPAVLRYLKEQGPEYLVIIPDWTSKPGMERSADCPAEVYDALMDGTAGYTLGTYFPPPSLLSGGWWRPPLDNPSVSPPVRVFARNDVRVRAGHQRPASER